MNKEKLLRLTKYAEDLKNRISSPVPSKHQGHPETYKQFLTRELEATTKSLDALKLEVGGVGK